MYHFGISLPQRTHINVAHLSWAAHIRCKPSRFQVARLQVTRTCHWNFDKTPAEPRQTIDSFFDFRSWTEAYARICVESLVFILIQSSNARKGVCVCVCVLSVYAFVVVNVVLFVRSVSIPFGYLVPWFNVTADTIHRPETSFFRVRL